MTNKPLLHGLGWRLARWLTAILFILIYGYVFISVIQQAGGGA
jgi:uncharacterized ion transporter superfamily protein YfcC